jgi:Flp pilus assembly protein TadG
MVMQRFCGCINIINLLAAMTLTYRKLLTSFSGDQHGIAAIEFGFIALPFFAILIAIFQIGLLFFAQNELETAVEKAARQLLTGSAQKSAMTQAQFVQSVCNNLPAFFPNCTTGALMVDLQTATAFSSVVTAPPTLTYDSKGNVTNPWVFNSGSAGSILVLRVMYQFPVILGPLSLNLGNLSNGNHLMMASSVFQVEPYSTTGG